MFWYYSGYSGERKNVSDELMKKALMKAEGE
jgi:hypothetical protein